MRRRANRIGAAALLTVMAVSVAACAQRPSAGGGMTRVTIAPSNEPASAPIFVAKEKGFFAEEGLDASVTRYPSGRMALDAVEAGKADFGTVAETPVARDVLDGKDPVLIATIAEVEGTNVIVGRRDRGISTPESLIGKRIGVLPGTTADYFLHVYLVTSGIDPKRVTRVSLDTTGLVPALVGGQVDAIAAFTPYQLEAQDGLGANGVLLDKPGLYTFFWNVAVRRESTRDPETIRRFLRAVIKAEDYITSHGEEARAITARWTGVPAKTLARLWPRYQWEARLDQTLVLAIEDEARWMSGRQDAADVLHHIDAAPMRQLRPDNVTLLER